MAQKDQCVKLLEAMKKTRDEMGNNSPKISFDLDYSLEEKIEIIREAGIPSGIGFLGLNIGGADVRIYGYGKGLKIYLNIGCVSQHQAFYDALLETVKFPLIIEDNCGYLKGLNQ